MALVLYEYASVDQGLAPRRSLNPSTSSFICSMLVGETDAMVRTYLLAEVEAASFVINGQHTN